MTNYQPLVTNFFANRMLQLLLVTEDGKVKYLIQNFHKRLTSKWYNNYTEALNDFKKINKKYAKK